MRIITYSEKYRVPFIDYVNEYHKGMTIMGGEFLDDGKMIALHCRKTTVLKSRRIEAYDCVIMVPVGTFPQTLEEAMDARQRELERFTDMIGQIVIPKKEQEARNAEMLRQLWALSLDPEVT